MNLLISAPFAEKAKGILEEKFPELNIYAVTRMTEALDYIGSIDIMFTLGISDDLMKRAEKLKWIQSMISGMDSILKLPSLKKDLILTSARGIHGPQMSELALLLMLALVKKFPGNIRNQDQKIWGGHEISLLFKKKVGILGVGSIGKEIARKCGAFDMKVYGIMSRKREVEFVDYPFGPDGLVNVIKEVDFFINVVPSTPETKKIIGEKEFSRGLYCHAVSQVEVRLPGPGKRFTALVGLDHNEDTARGKGSVIFTVRIMEKVAFQSEVMRFGTPALAVDVNHQSRIHQR